MQYAETAYDYDNVIYKVEGFGDSKFVKFSFKSNCSKHIMANGGVEMLESLYKEHMLPESEYDPLFDVSLKIDTTSIPKTQKVKKSMDEETAAKVRAENETIREKREVVAEEIASKIAKFKNDFLSAPIRKAMVASAGSEVIAPIEVPYRLDEKYWVVMPTKGEVIVFFSINFKNTTDMSLARVMLLEFQDSQRKVKTAPNVTFHDKEFPLDVSRAFPGSEKEQYSNGAISFSKYTFYLLICEHQTNIFSIRIHTRSPLCQRRHRAANPSLD